MSFNSTLVIADEANSAQNFVEIERSGTRVTRINDATTLDLPTKMVVSHNQSGSGVNVADRHLVQFAKTVEDAAGNQQTVICNLTIAVPRKLSSGVADSQELVGYLINFLEGTDAARTLANVDNVLLGES